MKGVVLLALVMFAVTSPLPFLGGGGEDRGGEVVRWMRWQGGKVVRLAW